MRVTVYGHTGTVGRQLFRWLGEVGLDPSGMSLDETWGEPGAEDWAFLCLPTPTTEDGQDLSAIEEVAEFLGDGERYVVIRSTVLPGTCARLQHEHPVWHVYHWPEFLTARYAWGDFRKPRVQVVGSNYDGGQEWEQAWLSVLPEPTLGRFFISLEAAEIIKYGHNLHGAMQVIFANLLEDIELAVDASEWEKNEVRKALDTLGYISHETILSYWRVYKDGYRGYGGACFPKDVDAMRGWLAGKAELLDGMAAANARLRGEA